jgi:SAM-dependent methyltransferase
MTDAWLSDTRSSYDADASGYAEKVRGLLGESPYLRASLALFAELVRGAGGGQVADIGCGPGYVTGHLHDAGVDVFGIDLSPEMIAIARRDYPDLRFEVGTMTDLDLADDSLVGIVAFWSVIHVPDHAMPGVFEQFRRVLRPQGLLLLGFHVGDEIRHTSEGYTGRPINVDTHHRRPSTVAGWLRDARFTIEAELVIGPDKDVPGAVIFARSDGPDRRCTFFVRSVPARAIPGAVQSSTTRRQCSPNAAPKPITEEVTRCRPPEGAYPRLTCRKTPSRAITGAAHLPPVSAPVPCRADENATFHRKKLNM